MIVKIMDPAGPSFPGVHYNDKKIDNGTGELKLMKNFPSFINESSSKEEVRNYLRAISIGNKKVQKPQFHAMISTKFQGHSKEELTKIAANFMDEMKYGEQPFIVVFHKDTDNNHVHIVSTRVDKQTGKKINDSYERLKAQKALSVTMEKLYGQKPEEELEKLLNYKISSLNQLETLLNRNGYKIGKNTNDENSFKILKNGVIQQTLSGSQIVFDNSKNDKRAKQIKGILSKYKELYSTNVFKVEDDRQLKSMLPKEKLEENDLKVKITFESELQKKLRDVFGIDMVFHHKEKNPFGYTVIDHKTQKVYKGSDLLKMNEVFEFTSEKLDKKTFEILKDYNIRSQETKKILLEFFKKNNPEAEIKDFMLFENRGKKDLETYRKVQFEVKDFIRNNKNTNDEKKDISITTAEDGKLYAVHTKFHYVGELQPLIGEKEYQKFLNPISVNEVQTENRTENNEKTELNKAVNELLFELMKSSGTAKDPAENELKKRRKKRR